MNFISRSGLGAVRRLRRVGQMAKPCVVTILGAIVYVGAAPGLTAAEPISLPSLAPIEKQPRAFLSYSTRADCEQAQVKPWSSEERAHIDSLFKRGEARLLTALASFTTLEKDGHSPCIKIREDETDGRTSFISKVTLIARDRAKAKH